MHTSSNNEEIFLQHHRSIPTKTSQEKIKERAKQEQPWSVHGSKKNYKQQQNTKNNNYKQQLLTNMTYSSAVSFVGPPLPFA
jgi:hypothetical protein